MIKRDGGRQPFSREKIMGGIARACEKRPVGKERMEKIVERIEQKVRSKGAKEIKSGEIGDMVMRELFKLDAVAYIRFASVYKSFDSPDEFRKAVLSFKQAKK